MDEGSHRTGLIVSGAMHVALLAVLVFGFSHAPRFDDATESIPVETVTTAQLNRIMEGEKTARPSQAKPAPAPAKAEPVPLPPTPPPPAPEPPKPPPPELPTPAPPPEPPTRPEPPKPAPPPPEPPTRPQPPKPQAENAPEPPTRPRPEKPVATPRPPERPRRTETAAKPDKFRPDEIAKALAREKAQAKPRRNAPAYDPRAIAKLIGQSKAAEAEPNAAQRQGLANRHSAQMSVSLENALNEWFRDSYKNCWNLPPTNPTGENYVFDVRVTFNSDGSLAARPVMLNPPHDPQWQAHADSVLRAVLRCNPLHIPAQYAPYFDQWRTKIVHFDPSSADG